MSDDKKPSDRDRPLLSMILITYKQQQTVEAALRAALAQTYSPLEIIVSDDASPDDSFDTLRRVAGGYQGPHKLVLHRNERNLGIGGNLSQAVALSSGELLVIAAGDDVSVPHRCERLAQAWEASGRKLDLIASNLVDLDEHGQTHAQMVPSDLGEYNTPADWLAKRPYVIGAAQAWTRRLFERFGPLPQGVVAEDLIMVFRAICAGGAVRLDEPLVQYRRGGISRRVRAMSAQDTIRRLLSNNCHALVEMSLLQQDARKANCEGVMRAWLDSELALARYIRDVFEAPRVRGKVGIALRAAGVPWSKRLRMLIYAAWPWLLAPWFGLKRMTARAQ
jgi:glycosyltransferase involved in cell wall biosynthesis